MYKMKLIEQIKQFDTWQIVEAVEETLQNECIRENLIETIKLWDSEAQEELLDYLKRKFREGGDNNEKEEKNYRIL